MSIISNTTVLSNFAALGRLDLIRQLFGALYIPTEVYEEIQDGLTEGYQFYAGIEQQTYPLAEDGWLHLTSMADDELRLFGAMPAGLHRGEAACLAIARQRGWLLLSDDRAARAEAARQGVRVSGSIGCLVRAVERGLVALEQGNAWLESLIALGYHSPIADLAALIKSQTSNEENTGTSA